MGEGEGCSEECGEESRTGGQRIAKGELRPLFLTNNSGNMPNSKETIRLRHEKARMRRVRVWRLWRQQEQLHEQDGMRKKMPVSNMILPAYHEKKESNFRRDYLKM
ncbi:hypothetical protein Y032_0056g2716 [Ancylostoma ceylanicum]|uniref:Uncharacterized protein n=1 Tax=Ancylostoma ceylanicum TaxID=53326 RepID=A0A016U6A8_9BILA|nr:hypothetical protein Y032_0056g2716 [Ancylostoma ceylanicum]